MVWTTSLAIPPSLQPARGDRGDCQVASLLLHHLPVLRPEAEVKRTRREMKAGVLAAIGAPAVPRALFLLLLVATLNLQSRGARAQTHPDEGPEGLKVDLDWQKRSKICVGIARGLAYLHEESRLKIVHRDIKTTNVLLDKDLNAKISEFGLVKLNEEGSTHISTRIAGTTGYIASEYALRGYLTDKADVYSFGVVTLEIVSGKSNAHCGVRDDFMCLLDWANALQEKGAFLDLVDPALGANFSKEEAQQMLNLGLLYTNSTPALRPAMSAVVTMLDDHTPVQVPTVKITRTESR